MDSFVRTLKLEFHPPLPGNKGIGSRGLRVSHDSVHVNHVVVRSLPLGATTFQWSPQQSMRIIGAQNLAFTFQKVQRVDN